MVRPVSDGGRQEPATEGLGEREMLDGWLDYHRATLEWKCQGLSEEDLKRRSVPPSNLTLLGLIRHMAEVERSWFRHLFNAEDAPPRFFTEERLNDDFDDLDSVPVEEAFAVWRDECERAREIARNADSLDQIGKKKNKRGEEFSLRWIVTHMIEEYARHNGHADLLREAIDGSTGD
jgi:uncharacterized damage-inducible protein DinB